MSWVFLHQGIRQRWTGRFTEHRHPPGFAQQGRKLLMNMEDIELRPEIVMRDNDVKRQA